MPADRELPSSIDAQIGQDDPEVSAKPDILAPAKAIKPPEAESEKYRQAIQHFLDSNRRIFAIYSGGADLRFVVGHAFMIDMEKHVVSVDASWFQDRGFTPQQTLWACLHEYTHFLETVEDEDGIKKHFENLFDRARDTGQTLLDKVRTKFGATEPEFVAQQTQRRAARPSEDPKRVLTPLEESAYAMHHSFRNALSDVYVNARVSYRAPSYQTTRPGGAEIRRLYREKLFAETDFRQRPRHLQFADALLRRSMVPDEPLELHPDVQAALDRPIVYLGKKYTAAKILEQFILPRVSRNTTATSRDAVIAATLEPIFDELLGKDIAEWDPQMPPPKKTGGGEGQPGEGEPGGGQPGEGEPQGPEEEPPTKSPQEQDDDKSGQPEKQEGESQPWNPLDKTQYGRGNIDHFDPDELEKWADQRQKEEEEKKQEEDKGKSEVERAQTAETEREKQWAKEQQLDYKTVKQYREVEEKIRPYLDTLARLWQHIVYGSAREIEQDLVGHFEHGIELDVQKAIDDWPDVQSGRVDRVRVMKRIEEKEVLVERPERIRVRLVADLSGSMSEPSDKLETLRETLVLISSSLREFNTYLNLTRAQTKSKLKVDVEITFFSSRFKVVKHFQSEVGDNAELRERMTMLNEAKPSGGTADFLPLEAILSKLTPADKKALANKKLMDLVFVTTDGGSDKAERTRQVVDKLNAAGVITRSFQIGTVSGDEQRDFNIAWNDGHEAPLGIPIGADVKQLVPAMALALKKYLGHVRL